MTYYKGFSKTKSGGFDGAGHFILASNEAEYRAERLDIVIVWSEPLTPAEAAAWKAARKKWGAGHDIF